MVRITTCAFEGLLGVDTFLFAVVCLHSALVDSAQLLVSKIVAVDRFVANVSLLNTRGDVVDLTLYRQTFRTTLLVRCVLTIELAVTFHVDGDAFARSVAPEFA